MMLQFTVWKPVHPGEPRRLMLSDINHGYTYYYGFYRCVALLP